MSTYCLSGLWVDLASLFVLRPVKYVKIITSYLLSPP